MYYIFLENGKFNGCGQCPLLTEGVQNIEVSEEVYFNFVEDELKYIYQNGEVVENPNYELENQARLDKQRAAEILVEMEELDKKRVRALCEDELKDDTTGETWLDYYNQQIKLLRDEYKSLNLAE